MAKRKKLGVFFLAGTAAASILIGSTAAYLTDFDTAANEFTVGKVDIELEEPSWKPEDHTALVPTEEIDKDPQIKNTGKNDAFVYLEVAVPVRKLITADADGKRQAAKDTELFSFTAGKEWVLMDSFRKESDMVYQYAYSTVVKPGETTKPLFRKMTFANVIEGQIDGAKVSVPVHAYAIQTANTGGEGKTPAEQAAAAVQLYINQNQSKNGAPSAK